MAIMYPSNIEAYNYTESEKSFYNELKNRLSDDFKVFYSIRWFKLVKGEKQTSECDFLIFHPNYGYITIEVKGGIEIDIQDNKWRILDSYSSDTYRILRRSPFKQAEESMYYFKDYYEEIFSGFYKGTYGFAVAFPFYNIKKDISVECPNFLIINKNDIENIEEKIISIFKYWRGHNNSCLPFSYSQQNKFIKMLNRRISLSAAAGSLIEIRKKELDKINRVQDSYIEFISNYHKAFIVGGAGTGKTWIGIKKAITDFKIGKRVLIITPTKLLANYIGANIEGNNIEVKCINELEILDEIKYDSIIVDEAQDFSEIEAEFICEKLFDRETSSLYVLYDNNQKIYNVNFKDKFNINNPPFLLNENIRNTSAIHNWCVNTTGIGKEIKPSIIEGVEPEIYKFYDELSAILKLENLLNTLMLKEGITNKSIVILTNKIYNKSIYNKYVGKYKLVKELISENEILFKYNNEYKGLESDVVIYLKYNTDVNSMISEYITYTRARFYLYVVEIDDK